jgi:hypothetical protein
MNAVRRSGSFLPFLALAASIYAAELILVRPAIPRVSRPGILVAALLVDLLVVIPAAYWFLCVRGRHSARRVMPVLLLSMAGAAAVLPETYRGVVPVIRLLAAPAELGIIAMVVVRARRTLREAPAGAADAAERIRDVIAGALPYPGAVDVVTYEVALLYYAVFGWRARPEAGEHVFTYHRKSGYGGIVFALLVATLVESVAVHLLVAPHSAQAAWLLTALSTYGVLWLMGDYQAVRLRSIAVTDDALRLRTGLRWTVALPWDAISAIVPARGATPAKGTAGWLRMAPMGAPNLIVELNRPVAVSGPYGITRRVQRIGLSVDEAARFLAAVEHRIAG